MSVSKNYDEDLAIADAPGLGGVLNGFYGGLDSIIGDHKLDFDLGQEINDVLRAAIQFRVTLLATKALGFENGDSGHTNFVQRFLHFVEFEGFDDRFDLFHVVSVLARARLLF